MPLPTEKQKPIVDPGRLIVTIHGISGIGKSTFCSRAEDVIFLAFEPGLNAIEAYKYEPEPGRYLIESWEEAWKAYTELREDNSRRFKTVCIDTGNAAFKACQSYICRRNGVQHETDIPGTAKGYTLINNEFARLIKAFTGLQMGLYIACHTREVVVKTKTQEWAKMVPDFPDKARAMLVSLSDFVLFCDIDEIEIEGSEGKKKSQRILHSRPTALYEAKYRFKPLNDPIPLSYAKFIEEFKAANTGGISGAQAPAAKAETKPEGKAEIKPEPKVEAKVETKVEAKGEPKGEPSKELPKQGSQMATQPDTSKDKTQENAAPQAKK